MNKFMQQAQALKEEIIEYRRTIHANPEVGNDLPITTKRVY